jgi:hypothetical protein
MTLDVQTYADGSELKTYVIDNTITIPSDKTLTVGAGAVLKFYPGDGLSISGVLNAAGTVKNPAVFTAYVDDRFGGDTNGDGFNTIPYNGYWYGINFNDSAPDNASTLENIIVHYGGTNTANLYFNSTHQSISNADVAYSSKSGIQSHYSQLDISDSDIYANVNGIYSAYSAGKLTINGGRIFANRDDGIELAASAFFETTGGLEIFGNAAYGLQSSIAVDAENIWWGASDGPGGEGVGSGDKVNANVDYANHRTTGTNFHYLNAGPNTSVGSLGAASVVQGESTDEWGTAAHQQAIYDFEKVSLSFSGLDSNKSYQLITTTLNSDNTSGSGGNWQHLEDGQGQLLQKSTEVAGTKSSVVDIPASSITEGNLSLNWMRDKGYRSAVSQVWLLDKNIDVDTTAPELTITSPLNNDVVGGDLWINGQANADQYIESIEVIITDSEGAIIWQPVDIFTSAGVWKYHWLPEESGSYVIKAQAQDDQGQVVYTSEYSYQVDLEAPIAVEDFYAHDTPADSGNSISLFWQMSQSSDVVNYIILRALADTDDYIQLSELNSDVVSYVDTTAVTDTEYNYKITATDNVGLNNSTNFGPVKALNNTLADSTAPEDVTAFTAQAGNAFASLSWVNSANTAEDLIDQRLDVSIDGGVSWGSNAPSYNNNQALSLGT